VRLTQVVLNLLNNAIKFTPKNGRIALTIDRHQDYVELSVKDSGRGIAANDLARVFEMFYQGAGGKGGGEGGLGLGLTLVQQLVEMHGGSVRAQSPGPGMGSEFSVRLPVVSGPLQATLAADDAKSAKRSSKRRILVVDDNRDAVESLAELLRMDGNDVHVAFDGEAAIKAASRFDPDIVVLDIGMPIVDGYSAAQTIRRNAVGRDLLLVAMTGWGHAEDKGRAMEAGFDAHLVKPVAIEALLDLFSSRKPGAAHNA
jgi:CheY-like chemotaxis protein